MVGSAKPAVPECSEGRGTIRSYITISFCISTLFLILEARSACKYRSPAWLSLLPDSATQPSHILCSPSPYAVVPRHKKHNHPVSIVPSVVNRSLLLCRINQSAKDMKAIKTTAPMTGPAIQALLEGEGVLDCVAAGGLRWVFELSRWVRERLKKLGQCQ